MGGAPHSGAMKAIRGAARAIAALVKPKIAFVCVWVGDKYGVEYVSILRNMVMRNASNLEQQCAFFALTDKPDDLPEGVYPIAAPDGLPGWWAKVALFSPDMPWERGQRVVYFDLDVAITGRLEDLVERPGIMPDPHWPCYNSSVMVWDHGDHSEIWRDFAHDLIDAPVRPALHGLLPAGQVNGGDQEWITECSRWDTFPRDWFVSYREAHAWPPANCKAVIFHGSPKPSEVTSGWVPNIWREDGFTSLPEFKGVNTTLDLRMENVRSAVKRDLPWFTGLRG